MAKRGSKTPMRGFQGYTLDYRLGYQEAFEKFAHWSHDKLRAEVFARERSLTSLEEAHRGETQALRDLLRIKDFEALTSSQQDVKCAAIRRSKVRDEESRVITWLCARRKPVS